MGTLGEKQDKPIYAKASPRRFGFYWQQCHHGNERGPHQLEPYTMQLAMFTPHAAGHSGADTMPLCFA
jgi:hypothetical protein